VNVERLVTMANDIGRFFAGEPRVEDRVAGVKNHIRRFWDPRMRRQIVDHLHAGGEGLDEPARSAVAALGADAASSG
jgi:formate dehydrogenase subunit delta